jgi:hypothetical protein
MRGDIQILHVDQIAKIDSIKTDSEVIKVKSDQIVLEKRFSKNNFVIKRLV